MNKKVQKYFSKHVYTNALTHAAAGIGMGIYLTHPLFDPHPLRFAALFVGLAALGYFYIYLTVK